MQEQERTGTAWKPTLWVWCSEAGFLCGAQVVLELTDIYLPNAGIKGTWCYCPEKDKRFNLVKRSSSNSEYLERKGYYRYNLIEHRI